MQVQAIQGYQLSPQQKRLWTLEQKFSDKKLCAQVGISLKGTLDVEKLKKVIQTISRETEILRTTFQQPVGMKFPLQVIEEEEIYAWEFINLENTDSADAIEQLWQTQTPDQPLKVTLIKIDITQHFLLLTLPSLCADPTTLELLVCAIRDCYAGESFPDGEEMVQYLQVSEWQNELLAETETNYWSKSQLKPSPSLTLPTQNLSDSRVESACYSIELIPFSKSQVTVDPPKPPLLRGATLEKLETETEDIEGWLLATWQVLLWRLTQRLELVINYGSDGRSDEELTETMGTLQKWLPLASSLTASLGFQEVIEQNQLQRREVLEWQDEWDCNPDLDLDVGFEFKEWSSLGDVDGVTFSLDRIQVEDHPTQLRLAFYRTEKGLVLQFY